jgi:hypothetical protein
MGKSNLYITVIDTAYLYPKVDILDALSVTQANVTYNGTNIICNTLADFSAFFYDMWYKTYLKNPVTENGGGYNLGVGTLLQDMNSSFCFILPSGSILARMQLVQQLTPQLPETVIPAPGNTPPATIGYIPTFISKSIPPPLPDVDPVRVIRV